MSDKEKVDKRNKLNELTGREWIRFTKSWFIADGKSTEITHEIDSHPASFPPTMIKEFIEFFTKPGDKVLDPFVGTGSTLVACNECGREGVGIELYEKYAHTAMKRTKFPVLIGDIREIIKTELSRFGKFSLCITSPPYWRILKKFKDYNQQERSRKGLDLNYGEDAKDFGMIETKERFLAELGNLFFSINNYLKDGGHLIVFIQNIRDKGETIPIAYELTVQLRKRYKFLGERIWLQNQKTLRPYGYPYAFVPNVHHHYALIFQKG